MASIQPALRSRTVVRLANLGLGVGTTLFGLVPLVAPRRFAETFGIPMTDGPAADVVVRSVSARDVISGIGIISATLHGGRVTPWILARALADGTDAVAIAIAYRSGARGWRLLLLGAIALGAALGDIVLYRANRQLAVSVPADTDV